jgi:hypothetical protein
MFYSIVLKAQLCFPLSQTTGDDPQTDGQLTISGQGAHRGDILI